jgi:DNA invertase Pin-like site-specific DNA recombinase
MKKLKAPVFKLGDPLPNEEVGYWRVSTGRDQDPDFQIALLKKRGIPDDNIFGDVMSGSKAKRPGLSNALRLMAGHPGWTLVFWKLDRLGRDNFELQRLAAEFQEKGWNMVSMTEGIDTKTPMGKAFYGMLSVFAQFERDTTIERTRAGMARRKELGVQLGRKTRVKLATFKDVERRLLKTPAPIAEIAKGAKMSEAWVNHWFPGWRSKSPAERKAYRLKRPIPAHVIAKARK